MTKSFYNQRRYDVPDAVIEPAVANSLSSLDIHKSCSMLPQCIVCLYVCLSSLVCVVGVIFVHIDTVYGCYGYSFLCLVGCFSVIIWTPTVLSVLNACVLYFCICTCSAQLRMLHMERRSRNTLIIIIIMFKIVLLLLLSSSTSLSLLLSASLLSASLS